jgi:hypothetical protein
MPSFNANIATQLLCSYMPSSPVLSWQSLRKSVRLQVERGIGLLLLALLLLLLLLVLVLLLLLKMTMTI